MARPERSNEYIAVATQSVFGTKPTNPTLNKIPFKDHTLGDVEIATKVDEGVRDNGQARYVSQGNKKSSGEINAPFVFTPFQLFFQNLFRCTPTAITGGVQMKVGSAIQYLYIEHGFKGTTLIDKLDSAIVSKIEIDANLNGDASLKMSILSRDAEKATTSQSTSDPVDEVIEQPLKHKGGYFKVGGVASAVVTGVKLVLDRNADGKYTQWGLDTITRYTSPGMSVTGSIDLLSEDLSFFDVMANNTTEDIEFTIGDVDGNTFLCRMPATAFTTHKRKVENDGTVTATVDIVALWESVEDSLVTVEFLSV